MALRMAGNTAGNVIDLAGRANTERARATMAFGSSLLDGTRPISANLKQLLATLLELESDRDIDPRLLEAICNSLRPVLVAYSELLTTAEGSLKRPGSRL